MVVALSLSSLPARVSFAPVADRLDFADPTTTQGTGKLGSSNPTATWAA